MRFFLVNRHRLDMAERIIAMQSELLDRLRKERDEQQSRADRAIDMLAVANGYAPVSGPVLNEIREKQKEEASAAFSVQEAMKQVDADLALDTEMDALIRKEERDVN